jgi:tRNA (guanine-N7-)-methyltransferase
MNETPSTYRPIRTFVLRQGRLTAAQERAFRDLWPAYGVDWVPRSVLDAPTLFGNTRALYLEIGFGNGEALVTLAERHPESNYLGIEVHRPGVGHLLLEIAGRGLGNVRVLRQDALDVLERGLAPASLAGVYLLFPDPWPKKKHHKRRILNPEFVRRLARVIQPGGFLHAATDWQPYARQMLEVLTSADDLFENSAGGGCFAPRPDERPLTRFELRGQRLGHAVWDLVFRRR